MQAHPLPSPASKLGGELSAPHPLTPSRAQTIAKAIPSLAREGDSLLLF